MTGAAARRAGVLGSPIAHSLSPLLHRAAYAVLGLHEWTYDAYDVSEAELPGFLAGVDESWAGLSLTMPLKAAVLPLLTTRGSLVDAVGAANTVLPRAGGLHGENTDVAGLLAALGQVRNVERAAVLGGGATARSAVAALAQLCPQVSVFLRSPPRAHDLAVTAAAAGVHLDVRVWQEASDGLAAALVVNTTPAGAADQLAEQVPDAPGVLLDVVYSPWPTPLATAWRERGGRVVAGLELLVQQAVRQVALMTGLTFDEPAMAQRMRLAGARAVTERGQPGDQS